MQQPHYPSLNDRVEVTCSRGGCPRTARAGKTRGEVLVVLATIALVVVPVATVEWPSEIARWHQAAATELRLRDDYVAAVASMDRAIAWNDSDAQLFLQRAQYKLNAQQWQGGLEDCDRARQLDPDDPLVGELRSQFLQHLGRHREAVAEWREILQAGGSALPVDRAHQLNGMAYAMAVGDVDLEQGLAAVEASLRIIGDVAAILDPAGVLCFGRAVTARNSGDNQLALSSLSEAREYAETALQVVSQQTESHGEQDPRRSLALANELQALRSHLAGILQLRVNICAELGKPEDATRDEQRIKEITVDGNLAVVLPYDLPTAVSRVNGCANVLDTRGYLYCKLEEWAAAREDLQRAVQAMQWVYQAMPWLIEASKNYVSDIRPLVQEQRQQKRSLAVITYHRSLVLQALGMQQEADQDRQKIRDLGYEPGDDLF
jgi:tetratricopeptide (TPR) repeat protein